MHRSLRLLAAVLPLPFAVTGCGLVLGIDDFKDAPATGGGGTGGTPTGGGGTTTTGGGGTGGGGTGGTLTGGGGTGGTTGTVCTPNEKVDCYEGPDGSLDVGACKGGQKQCNASGTDFGPCEGQVLPEVENCLKATDDDCDGLDNLMDGCCIPSAAFECYTGPPGTKNKGQCVSGTATCNADGTIPADCQGQILPAQEFCAEGGDEDCNGKDCWVWTVAKGSFGSEYGSSIATQPFQKKIVVGGAFKGSLDLGGGVLNSAGNQNNDPFLAVFNPDGTHVWSKKFGDTGSEAINAVTWDMNGGIAAVGHYLFGGLDLGGGALGDAQSFDGFVGRFQADGTHYWSTAIGGPGSQRVVSAKWVTDGLLVAGEYDGGTVLVGGSPITSAGGDDLFVAKFDDMTTDLLWVRTIGGTGAEAATSVTMDGDFVSGAAYVAGHTSTTGLDLGTGPLASGSNFFLARLGADGQTAWAKGFNVSGFGFSVANGPYLAGTFQGTALLGGAALSADGQDIVVAAYTGSNGSLVWQKSFGGPGNQGVTTAVSDVTGIWIAGIYDTAFELGGETLPAPGVPGAGSYVAKLDTGGNVLWVHAMGGAPAGLTFDDDRFALLTGDFHDIADFGGGALSAVGSADVFLTRLGK